MRTTTLFGLLALGAALLASCGSPTAAPQPPVMPQPTEMPMPAPSDTAQPPAAPSQPAAPASSGTAETRVNITLRDNTISSNLTTFKTGVVYKFVISNQGHHEHNFNIAPPVIVAGGYAEALAQALLAVDETQIPPGSSFSVDFTFPDSAAGAKVEFSCLIRRHYEDGMRLDITVTN